MMNKKELDNHIFVYSQVYGAIIQSPKIKESRIKTYNPYVKGEICA